MKLVNPRIFRTSSPLPPALAGLLWTCLLIAVLGAGASRARAAEPPEKLDLIVAPSGTFSNVTIVDRTDSHVTIKSAAGEMAILQLSELDSNTVLRLKGEWVPPGEPMAAESESSSLQKAFQVGKSGGLSEQQMKDLEAKLREVFAPGKMVTVLGILLGVFLILHLLVSFCLKLICQKAGSQPGLLVWIPILQQFPMLKAAGMSPWWFLANFVPLLNLVAWILWCVKITQARGKSLLTAILLILPVTGIFAFLYLAFSSEAERPDSSAPPRQG